MNKLMKGLVISIKQKNIKQLYCIYYFLFHCKFYRIPIIPISVISDALGHDSEKTTLI